MAAHRPLLRLVPVIAVLTTLLPGPLVAQQESVNPGVNDSFLSPDADVERFIGMFEGENREIFRHRDEIVEAVELDEGDSIADIGAGTGFFSRIFASIVGDTGRVYSVDIAPSLLEHMRTINRQRKLDNIEVIEGGEREVHLDEGVVDKVFVCDTYHHFEYPKDILHSIHRALRPQGELVIVDFERVVGVSPEFAIGHLRAGKGTFSDEIRDAGFEFVEEVPIMKDQYFLRFLKR